MAGWLQRLIGGGAAGGVTDGGQWSDWLADLTRYLQGAVSNSNANFAGELVEATVGYVSGGGNGAVLGRLASTGLASYVDQRSGPKAACYKRANTATPGELERWGRVLHSLPRNHGYSTRLTHGVPEWLTALIDHLGERYTAEGIAPVHMESLERALVDDGYPADALVVAIFVQQVKGHWGADAALRRAARLQGFDGAVARHSEVLRPLLQAATDADQRVHMATLLSLASDATVGLLAEPIASWAAATSKQVRQACAPLVARLDLELEAPLWTVAREAKPDVRALALQALWDLSNGDVVARRGEVASTGAADKAESVRALVAALATAASEDADSATLPSASEVPRPQWRVPRSPELDTALTQLERELSAGIEVQNVKNANLRQQGYRWAPKNEPPLPRAWRRDLDDFLNSAHATVSTARHFGQYGVAAFMRFALSPGVSVVATFKVGRFLALGVDFNRNNTGLSFTIARAVSSRVARDGRPTLTELHSLLSTTVADPPRVLVEAFCRQMLPSNWDRADLNDYFGPRTDDLVAALAGVGDHRERLYDIIGSLDQLPSRLANALFNIGLGTARSERALAQSALSVYPGLRDRAAAGLVDGRAEVRAVAAKWLGSIGEAEAIEVLRTALAKEKQDQCKGAILDALQSLGEPIERYLTPAVVRSDALATLKKGVPKDLEWFPWPAVPSVRWAASGEVVEPDVLKGLLVQAVKAKSVEPNAVLRFTCGTFEPRDRAALGQMVLEAWLAEDIRPIEYEAALAQAQQSASQQIGWMSRSPQHYTGSPHLGMSLEQLTMALLPQFQGRPAGSAISTKGLLAVTAAAADGAIAPKVAQYLKQYYGTRAAQGRALIGMLAWVESPAAIQLMLSIGNRFRTKSFQEEATKQAQSLAERKGWTLAELADRTIPTAGFDEGGVLELSFGVRCFTAHLVGEFKVELRNPDGKTIASLPDPRQDDDSEAAALSKKALSAGKKELKQIVSMQTERLYEAMCTQRQWPVEDWLLYLHAHPIVGRLVRRLVWVVTDGDGAVIPFRPMDDGTFTDVDDNAVSLPTDGAVALAHDSLLPDDVVAAWQDHLADYKVVSLFSQLGRGMYRPTEQELLATTIETFKGHLIETFALRGRATKLGYTRGEAQDGGWFMWYEKRFPTLGLLAVIEFTGNALPEENRTAALLSLEFRRLGGDRYNTPAIGLRDVPPVLLSECYGDLRTIAADGQGFAADWEKRSSY